MRELDEDDSMPIMSVHAIMMLDTEKHEIKTFCGQRGRITSARPFGRPVSGKLPEANVTLISGGIIRCVAVHGPADDQITCQVCSDEAARHTKPPEESIDLKLTRLMHEAFPDMPNNPKQHAEALCMVADLLGAMLAITIVREPFHYSQTVEMLNQRMLNIATEIVMKAAEQKAKPNG